MAKEISIDIPGLSIAAKAWGNPQKKPILAIHGWLDNAASFDKLAPYFPDHYFVAIDLPGHGLSQHKTEDARYYFIDSVFDVAHIIKKLNWEKFILLGHSLGAAMSPLIASTLPHSIEQVILIDGIGPYSRPAEQSAEQLKDAVKQTLNFKSNLDRVYATPEKAVMARHKAGHVTPEDAAILASRGTRKVEQGFVWHHDKRLMLKSPYYFTEDQVQVFFKAMTMPVCFIRALSGLDIDPELISGRLATIQKLTHVELQGGHHLHMEEPQAVAEAIHAFLQASAG